MTKKYAIKSADGDVIASFVYGRQCHAFIKAVSDTTGVTLSCFGEKDVCTLAEARTMTVNHFCELFNVAAYELQEGKYD